MRLFPPEPVIGPNDGFNEHDIFGYAKFGEQLKDFYASFDDPLVGVLDAPWGSGKSTFIKMWCGHMRNAGYPVIEFDAFKNDYTDDAFMALVGEVFAKAEEYCNAAKDEKGKQSVLPKEQKDVLVRKIAKLFRFARKRGTTILSTVIKGVVTKLAGKAIGDEEFNLLKDEFGELFAELVKDGVENGGKEVGAAIEELIDSRFAIRGQEKRNFEDFSKQLSEIALQLKVPALKLASSDVAELDPDKVNRPLIFVIDELDRCRPIFALALLEKIKHFFSVPNVQFLLVTNLEQLATVVESVYGQKINAQIYLQKFYDMSFSLPTEHVAQRVCIKSIFCGHVIKQCQSAVTADYLCRLAKSHQLTLRDVLKVHAYAACIAHRSNNAFGREGLIIGLACMKVKDPLLFQKAVDNVLTTKDVSTFFAGQEHSISTFRASFLFALGVLDESDTAYKSIRQSFGMFPEDAPELIKNFAQSIERLNFSN